MTLKSQICVAQYPSNILTDISTFKTFMSASTKLGESKQSLLLYTKLSQISITAITEAFSDQNMKCCVVRLFEYDKGTRLDLDTLLASAWLEREAIIFDLDNSSISDYPWAYEMIDYAINLGMTCIFTTLLDQPKAD